MSIPLITTWKDAERFSRKFVDNHLKSMPFPDNESRQAVERAIKPLLVELVALYASSRQVKDQSVVVEGIELAAVIQFATETVRALVLKVADPTFSGLDLARQYDARQAILDARKN